MNAQTVRVPTENWSPCKGRVNMQLISRQVLLLIDLLERMEGKKGEGTVFNIHRSAFHQVNACPCTLLFLFFHIFSIYSFVGKSFHSYPFGFTVTWGWHPSMKNRGIIPQKKSLLGAINHAFIFL